MADMRSPDAPAAANTAYVPLRPARATRHAVRTVELQVYEWGDASLATPERPTLLMMPGIMGNGIAFQFVVDELARLEGASRHIVSAEWRGCGASSSGGADSFLFPDHLADLDALVDVLSPDRPIDLLGLSMGGSIVTIYAGVRPARIRRLINLEGVGQRETSADVFLDNVGKWLDQLKAPPVVPPCSSFAEVCEQLQRYTPSLSADRVAWFAPHRAQVGDDGLWHLRGEPAQLRVAPFLLRLDEVLAVLGRITARMLWVEGASYGESRSRWNRHRWPGFFLTRDDLEARLARVRNLERLVLPDCGHLIQFDQPELLAAGVRDFLSRG
ncbi:MAG: alpha/beta hydrolase [Burkholderiaceae bacterium]